MHPVGGWKTALPLMVLWLVVSTVSPSRAATVVLPGDTYEGPLRFRGGRPALEVWIGAEGPFPFVLDTGAGKSMVDGALAERLGLRVTGRQKIAAPGLDGREVEIVEVPEVRFDGVVVRGEPFIALDLAGMTGGSFVGVLSYRALAELTLTLDFAGGRLRLDGQPIDPKAAGVIEVTPGEVLEFPIQVGGRTLPAHLDTGSPAEFAFPRHLIEGLEMASEPVEVGRARLIGGESAVWSARLAGEVEVGSLRYAQPEIQILDLPLPAVNIGSALLSKMVARVDQRAGLLELLPGEKGPQPSVDRRTVAAPRGERFGIQVAPGPPAPSGVPLVDGGLPIAGVEGGSRAERTGLAAGDLVLKVHDREVSELDGATLGRLLSTPEPYRIVIRRAGATLELQVPPA